MLAEAPISTHTIQGNAGELFVTETGTGGLPILFTHSFGGSSEHWKNQLEFLSKTRKVIAFDFRGHGKSENSSENNYTAEELANDIEVVADSMHLKKFILIGHSMGGAASIAYAGMHPDRVAALILVGTPGKSEKEQSQKIISSLESDSYQQVMDQYMNSLLNDGKPSTKQLVNGEIKKMSKEASLNIIKSMFNFDPLPSIKKYNGPKFIIYTAMEKQSGSLHNQVPEIPSKMFEGTSHWIMLDKPEEFNDVILKFINGIQTEK